MTNPAITFQLVYILGWVNLLGIGLVFFSCRCLVGPKLFQKLLQYRWYQTFYRWHCKWWYLFFASVALHVLLAFRAFGNPF